MRSAIVAAAFAAGVLAVPYNGKRSYAPPPAAYQPPVPGYQPPAPAPPPQSPSPVSPNAPPPPPPPQPDVVYVTEVVTVTVPPGPLPTNSTTSRHSHHHHPTTTTSCSQNSTTSTSTSSVSTTQSPVKPPPPPPAPPVYQPPPPPAPPVYQPPPPPAAPVSPPPYSPPPPPPAAPVSPPPQASPVPAPPSYAAGGGGGASDDYSTACLGAHNDVRSLHGAQMLSWSQDLVDSAQMLAETCNYHHDVTLGNTPYGQNIAAGNSKDEIETVIKTLFYANEEPLFAPNYGLDQPDMSGFEGWGHYTQICWAETTEVGCFTADCTGQGLVGAGGGVQPYFTVCNYRSPGNYDGQYAQNVKPPRTGGLASY